LSNEIDLPRRPNHPLHYERRAAFHFVPGNVALVVLNPKSYGIDEEGERISPRN
jgi:hypothetical protein